MDCSPPGSCIHGILQARVLEWFAIPSSRGKDPDAGKDWRQKEKRVAEDEVAGWHHWFNAHDLRQTPGENGGQGGLACCSPWGHKELDTAREPNNNYSRRKRALLPCSVTFCLLGNQTTTTTAEESSFTLFCYFLPAEVSPWECILYLMAPQCNTSCIHA